MLRRLLLTLLLLLSLLFTLAFTAGTLFPANFGPYPAGYRDRSVATFFIQSYPHFLVVYFLTHPFTPRSPAGGGGEHDAGQDIEFNTILYGRGFHYQHLDYVNNSSNLVTIRGHEFQFPYWMLALAFFCFSFLLALPHLRRRKPPSDPHSRPCPHCQYDLRAHPPDATCPECGSSLHG